LIGLAIVAAVAAGQTPPKAEVLLPEVVGEMVAEGTGAAVRVLATESRCIGVTHAKDLGVVRSDLSRQVARGIRPERLWGGLA